MYLSPALISIKGKELANLQSYCTSYHFFAERFQCETWFSEMLKRQWLGWRVTVNMF
jgi:hypothetical protein